MLMTSFSNSAEIPHLKGTLEQNKNKQNYNYYIWLIIIEECINK